MNFFRLFMGLKLWGSVINMVSALYILFQRKSKISRTGFYLALLEADISLILLCSLAVDLGPVFFGSPNGTLYLLLRLLLILLRCQLAVFSAYYIYLLLQGADFIRLYMGLATVGSFLTAGWRAVSICREVLFGTVPEFLKKSQSFSHAGCLLFITFSLLILIRSEKGTSPVYFRALMAFLLFPLITGLVFFPMSAFFPAADLSCSFSSIAMYVILLLHRQQQMQTQEENMLAERTRLARQKEELNQIENQLVLSQLQPEFLKDTLMTISDLCDTDTEAARRGVTWFSDYLRENMDSLKKSEPVHFEIHLAHIRSFLDLESLKFGDRLKACFDFETVNFFIPTLCIQPLLENAIRYGISPAGSGTITLRTRKKEDHVCIDIIDDGIGFLYSPEEDRKGSYPDIRAVRSRIINLSGGTLEICSTPGKGTLARIIIPTNDPEEPL